MRIRMMLLFVMLLSLLAGCRAPQQELQTITLPMGYVANVQFSPVYVAMERGYFREAGFDVTLDYRWETDGIQLVAAGTLPFTIASGDQIIQARSRNLPVVAVASWFRRFPVGIIALPEHPLNTPADLRGLRIGTPVTFGASYIGLRALLKAGGLTENDVDIQEIGYAQLAALTSGTVDAVVVYANNEPVVLTQRGIAHETLFVKDYANMVSNAVVTSDVMLRDNPEQVQAFVNAFLRGLADVLADPDAAFEISYKYVEGLEENAEAQRAVLEATLEFWRAEQLGSFDPQAWAEAQQVMLEAGLIEEVVPVESLFTNQFIP